MKEFCNKLMSLDCGTEKYRDYGQIAFLFFLFEKNLINRKIANVYDYCIFLHRFYSDNYELAKKHNNKLINNIYICNYKDLLDNAIENLNLIKEKTNLIDYDEENIYWKYDINPITDEEKKIIYQVQTFVASKYTGISNFYYNSELNEIDYDLGENSCPGHRLFNRCLEKINYCFICEESDINKLRVIRFQNSIDSKLDVDNYMLLCESHAKKYKAGELSILENGKATENGKDLRCRLEISTLKKIRKYLR